MQANMQKHVLTCFFMSFVFLALAFTNTRKYEDNVIYGPNFQTLWVHSGESRGNPEAEEI